MKTWVWIVGLWLVGIGHVMAFDLGKPETLRYTVSWGPLQVGNADLSYRPEGQAYVVRAEVKDTTPLLELHDVWESRGLHASGRAFVPEMYHVVQAENEYRADKTMTFDRAAGVVRYTNRRDASDVAEPLNVGVARDVLATVYAWRLAGEAEIGRAEQVPLVSLKREILLERKAGVKTTVSFHGKAVKAWKVEMRTIKDGKSSKDRWTVYVSDDVVRVPLKILATTKFGTFSATLKK